MRRQVKICVRRASVSASNPNSGEEKQTSNNGDYPALNTGGGQEQAQESTSVSEVYNAFSSPNYRYNYKYNVFHQNAIKIHPGWGFCMVKFFAKECKVSVR